MWYTINMLKTYKYRLYPDDNQKDFLSRQFGCCRFVYNWGLELKTKSWQADKKGISIYEIANKLPELKKEKPWLTEVCSQPLQQSLFHLEKGFTSFFRKRTRYPRFKSKWDKQAAAFPQHVSVEFSSGTMLFPKLGRVRAVFSRMFSGTVKTVTVTKTPTGKYFASVLVEDERQVPNPVPETEERAVGIDLGLKDFLTLSTGEKVENPKYFDKEFKRLACLQRRLSKKKKGSANRNKARLAVALCHEKIVNKRMDFLHKLSTRLVREFDTLCFEDLHVAGMIKNRHLSRAIGQVGWGMFVRLCETKATAFGKHVRKIGRFEPSSKLCFCGYINSGLKLSERVWTCPACGQTHDRDVLAAVNIKRMAFATQNTLADGEGGPVERPVNKRARRSRKAS